MIVGLLKVTEVHYAEVFVHDSIIVQVTLSHNCGTYDCVTT